MTRESRRRGEGRCWVDKPQPGLATLLVVSGKRDAEQECRQTVYAKATPWSCPPTPPPRCSHHPSSLPLPPDHQTAMGMTAARLRLCAPHTTGTPSRRLPHTASAIGAWSRKLHPGGRGTWGACLRIVGKVRKLSLEQRPREAPPWKAGGD